MSVNDKVHSQQNQHVYIIIVCVSHRTLANVSLSRYIVNPLSPDDLYTDYATAYMYTYIVHVHPSLSSCQ